MEDKNIFLPLGGEGMRMGGAGCMRAHVCGEETRMEEFFFCEWVHVSGPFVCLCAQARLHP